MAEEMQDIIDKETMQLAGGPEALQSPPTIEELLQTHLLHRRKFEDSEEWTSLKTYLRAEQERGVKITKLVGLGMGSCQNNTYGSVWAQSLQKETALLSALMVFLNIKVCVSQDPVFGDIDKAFVELLGHEVVDDPEAFEVIDERNLRMG